MSGLFVREHGHMPVIFGAFSLSTQGALLTDIMDLAQVVAVGECLQMSCPVGSSTGYSGRRGGMQSISNLYIQRSRLSPVGQLEVDELPRQ